MHYLKNKFIQQRKQVHAFSAALIFGLSLALIIASTGSIQQNVSAKLQPLASIFAQKSPAPHLDRQEWGKTFLGSDTDKQLIGDESLIIKLGTPINHKLQEGRGGDRIHEESHTEIQNRLNESVARLQAEQILPSAFTAPPVQFSLPIKSAQNTSNLGFHTISNYVDHNPITNQLQEYRCGTRTYDASDGYNHTGTDFMPFPFPWQKMDHDEVQVIAAAAGVIIDKQDGYFDRECFAQATQGNQIFLQHPDGTQSWYLHLKNGSVLAKSIGDSVEAGEYLGVIGSSGRSNGPHLHFEVHDADGNLVDPFFGAETTSCNPTATESWWIDQPAYDDSGINDIIFSADPPLIVPCQKTILPEQTQFAPGTQLYMNAFYRNDLISKETEFELVKPDGSAALTWQHTPIAAHSITSVWSFPIPIPTNMPLGQWKMQAKHNNVTYERTFEMAASVAPTPTPTETFTPVPTADPATATPIPATNTSTPIPATNTPTPIPATNTPTSIPATNTSTVPATTLPATTLPATTLPATTLPGSNAVYLPAVQK